jgi:hypothetical protein
MTAMSRQYARAIRTLDPVHGGEVQVHDGDVVALRAKPDDRLPRVFGGVDGVTLAGQRRAQSFPARAVVVDDQDAATRACRRGRHRERARGHHRGAVGIFTDPAGSCGNVRASCAHGSIHTSNRRFRPGYHTRAGNGYVTPRRAM